MGALGPSYEDHVGCVVAHAFAQYVFASRGPRVRRRARLAGRWPRLARMGRSRGRHGRIVAFEILRAMGVAERSEPFDNDAFTNIAAATVLRDAVAVASQVGVHGAAEAWALMADRIAARRPRTG